MNRLSLERRAQILHLLVEGNSVNGTCRITDTAKHTVLKLLADVAAACQKYQDEHLRGLNCERIQCDEIWDFIYAKQKNVPAEKRGQFGFGDVWTWTAICPDCKLVPSWHVGTRDANAATVFLRDLSSRLSHRVQLTTDGHAAYLSAVDRAFGFAFRENTIDYAMLIKLYGKGEEGPQTRYSPPVCLGTKRDVIRGNPDPEHICTSHVERQNLTMRMGMRRFTRLTNGHSKKLENHCHAIALHFMHYNFARINQAVRCTPAMEAGVSDHVWTMQEIAALADETL
jgi:IS1 family transposase